MFTLSLFASVYLVLVSSVQNAPVGGSGLYRPKIVRRMEVLAKLPAEKDLGNLYSTGHGLTIKTEHPLPDDVTAGITFSNHAPGDLHKGVYDMPTSPKEPTTPSTPSSSTTISRTSSPATPTNSKDKNPGLLRSMSIKTIQTINKLSGRTAEQEKVGNLLVSSSEPYQELEKLYGVNSRDLHAGSKLRKKLKNLFSFSATDEEKAKHAEVMEKYDQARTAHNLASWESSFHN